MAGFGPDPSNTGDHSPASVRIAGVLLERGISDKCSDLGGLVDLDRRRLGAVPQRWRAPMMARGRRQ
eukprot:14431522-Alexandrium_andersonii.AAC.1